MFHASLIADFGAAEISNISAAEQQRQMLQIKREDIERRTLESTHRSLGLLEDTE